MVMLKKVEEKVNNLIPFQEEITNTRLKRYSLEQKLEFLQYMNCRKTYEENRSNLSAFAEYNKVSRTTLYGLEKKFEEDFGINKPGPKANEEKELNIKLMEELRKKEEEFKIFHEELGKIEKKVEENKERILKSILQAAVSPVSTRDIREQLKVSFGVKVSKSKIKKIINKYSEKAYEILKNMGKEGLIEFLGVDEIFVGNKPILIGVDLTSFAVVIHEKADNRDHKVWHQALSVFPHLKIVVSDRAQGIIKAVYLCGNARHQFDIFHFKRDAGRLIRNLESQAYNKIKKEYEAKDKLEKAKNKNEEKFRKNYRNRKEEALEAIKIFDNTEKSINSIYEALEIFNYKGEFIANPSKYIRKINKAVTILNQMDNKKIKNIAKQASNPQLILYIIELEEQLLSIPLEWQENVKKKKWKKIIQILARFWYFNNHEKIHVSLKQDEIRKQWATRREKIYKDSYINRIANLFEVREVQMILKNFQEVMNKINSCLDNIFRASSLVESWNSQVRVVQQVKKGFNNNFLSLLALKWNMTSFENGKRKGKTPFEILGIKLSSDNWLDLLVNS